MDSLKQTNKIFKINEGYLPESRGRKEYCVITNNAIKLFSIHPSITPTPIDKRPIFYKDGQATKDSLRLMNFFIGEIEKEKEN